jgi:hypothetical protein
MIVSNWCLSFCFPGNSEVPCRSRQLHTEHAEIINGTHRRAPALSHTGDSAREEALSDLQPTQRETRACRNAWASASNYRRKSGVAVILVGEGPLTTELHELAR